MRCLRTCCWTYSILFSCVKNVTHLYTYWSVNFQNPFSFLHLQSSFRKSYPAWSLQLLIINAGLVFFQWEGRRIMYSYMLAHQGMLSRIIFFTRCSPVVLCIACRYFYWILGGGPQKQHVTLPMIMLISLAEENRCQELLKMYLDLLQLVPVLLELTSTVLFSSWVLSGPFYYSSEMGSLLRRDCFVIQWSIHVILTTSEPPCGSGYACLYDKARWQ